MDLGYTYSRRAWRSVDVFEVNPPWIDALLAVLSRHAGDCYGPIVRCPAVFERESDLKSTANWQRRRREDRRRKLIFATTYYAAFTLSAALALTITIATVLRRNSKMRTDEFTSSLRAFTSLLSCHSSHTSRNDPAVLFDSLTVSRNAKKYYENDKWFLAVFKQLGNSAYLKMFIKN